MGLDQYMYLVAPHNNNTNFSINYDIKDDKHVKLLAEWRKHPNLQGWMEKLFNTKADREGYVGQTEQSDIITKTMTTMPEDTSLPEGVHTIHSMDEVDEIVKEEIKKVSSKTFITKRVFNQQLIRLTLADLDQLEMAIKLGELPITEGFFFGDNADEENKERDLKIIKVAQEAIKSNLEVYYNSWW